MVVVCAGIQCIIERCVGTTWWDIGGGVCAVIQCIIDRCVGTTWWDIGGSGVCWDTMYHRGCVGW